MEATPSSENAGRSSSEESAEEGEDFEDLLGEQDQTNSCLFCLKTSDSSASNIKHMTSEHGLYIPEMEQLSSPDTIIAYLRTVIVKYHECLYCGVTRQSVEGVRRHMLDKGHCMINLEREPELLEFWELSDEDESDTDDDEAEAKPKTHTTASAASRDVTEGEYTLPSGKLASSKGKAREARLFARRAALATQGPSGEAVSEDLADEDASQPAGADDDSLVKPQAKSKHRAVAVRDAAGLIGVSDQQKRSLAMIQKKMQRQQALVHETRAWEAKLGGSHQKHSKVKMELRYG